MNGPGSINPEMVALFRQELEQHVATLDSALRRLDQSEDVEEQVGRCSSAVHEISGAARLLHLDEVSQLAKSVESLLHRYRGSQKKITPDVLQGLSAATDAFRAVLQLKDQKIAESKQWSQHLLDNLLSAQRRLTLDTEEEQSTSQAPDPSTINHRLRESISSLSRYLVGTQDYPYKLSDELQIEVNRAEQAAREISFPVVKQLLIALCRLLKEMKRGEKPAASWDSIVESVEWLRRYVNIGSTEQASWVESNKNALNASLQSLLLETPSTIHTLSEPENAPVGQGTEPMGDNTVDDHILGLFFVELETQSATLNDGLLALEANPHDEETMATLMRSAHSIKGAARVLGLTALIDLAHALEDALSVVKDSGEGLVGRSIDIMFSAVDCIANLSKTDPSQLSQWMQSHAVDLERSMERLRSLTGESKVKPEKTGVGTSSAATFSNETDHSQDIEREESAGISDVAIDKEELPIEDAESSEIELPNLHQTKGAERRLNEAEQAKRAAKRDRVLRVTAEYLTRLMGLAGEILVESKWLHPFSDALMQLKKNQYELSGIVDILRANLDEKVLGEEGEQILLELQQKTQLCRNRLTEHLDDLELYIRRHTSLSDRLYREVITSRMCPFAEGVDAFPRMVRDLAKQLGKKVNLKIIGRSVTIDRDILDKLKAPLTHLLRNAVDHGIEPPQERVARGKSEVGTIFIEARHRAGVLSITVSDDGRGIELGKLRQQVVEKKLVDQAMAKNLTESELMDFLFLPGFSTTNEVTEVSGRGVGLNVVQNMVHEVSGQIRVASTQYEGMRFSLQLPLTLSVLRALQVQIGDEAYAFPLARIERAMVIHRKDVQLIENRQYYEFEGQNIGLISGCQILQLEEPEQTLEEVSVVVLSDNFNQYGVVVDRLVGEVELVVQELEPRLGKVSDISCGAFLEDGTPILVIDVEDMVRSVDKLLSGGFSGRLSEYTEDEQKERKKKILVVDDSITVREVECRLLENFGYEVDVAVNGVDGWNTVRIGDYDLVVTDVDMPRMNGIELVRHIKQDTRLRNMPVMIVSYKERSEDRMQGMEAGANYYLAKSSFHDDRFLEAVRDLIGDPTETR